MGGQREAKEDLRKRAANRLALLFGLLAGALPLASVDLLASDGRDEQRHERLMPLVDEAALQPSEASELLWLTVHSNNARPDLVSRLLELGGDPLYRESRKGPTALQGAYSRANTPEGFAIFERLLSAISEDRMQEHATEILPPINVTSVPLMQRLFEAGLPRTALRESLGSGRGHFVGMMFSAGRTDLFEALDIELPDVWQHFAVWKLMREGPSDLKDGVYGATIKNGVFVPGLPSTEAQALIFEKLIGVDPQAVEEKQPDAMAILLQKEFEAVDFKYNNLRTVNSLNAKRSQQRRFFDLFMELAERGHPCAYARLAPFYESGNVTDQSFQKAFEHLHKAYALGCQEAASRLARYYEKSNYHKVIEPDPKKAFDLYADSAERGDDHSAYKLFEILRDGNEVIERNLMKAYEWLVRAAELGNERAKTELKECRYNGMFCANHLQIYD